MENPQSESHLGRKPTGEWKTLLKARQKANLSQAALAEQIGVQQGTISHWETLRYAPPRRNWPRLANFLDMPVEDFVNDMLKAFKLTSQQS